MAETGDWTQLLVRVGGADAAVVADRIWAYDPAAIEERDDGSVLLMAGFDDPDRAAAAGVALEALGVASVHLRPVTDHGLDGWRAWAKVEQAGSFTLVPAWLDPPESATGHTIVIDPGRTFGSGSHPTTRLVLTAMGHLVEAGDRVLDVGCGSGILSIGAALLGADHVLGLDIDPDAPGVTEANARANGVADRISARGEDLSSVVRRGERFDVVAANLLAPVVVDLASDLVAALAPGASLIVSGLLEDRWEATAAALEPLLVSDLIADDGWVALVLSAP